MSYKGEFEREMLRKYVDGMMRYQTEQRIGLKTARGGMKFNVEEKATQRAVLADTAQCIGKHATRHRSFLLAAGQNTVKVFRASKAGILPPPQFPSPDKEGAGVLRRSSPPLIKKGQEFSAAVPLPSKGRG